MAILYYRDPGTGNWLPMQSSGAPGPPGPEEVIVQNGPPSLLTGLDIWIDPDEDPGSGLYADLAYVDAANTAQNSVINGKVAKAGDTMTGSLTAPKVVLDDGASSASFVSAAGDGGSVRVQAADGSRGWVLARGVDVTVGPTAPTHLTNKEYVDAENAAQDALITASQTAANNAQTTANTANTAAGTAQTAANAAQGSADAAQATANAALPKAGGTMTGPIVLAADPAAAMQPATKQYVDARIWFGTLAAYNAIGTKDPTVLYVVTG